MKMVCIVCPKGCHMTVNNDKKMTVTGNGCERGLEYAKAEITAPVRTLTSTVCVNGGIYSRCSVKTDKALPKELVFEAVCLLDTFCLRAPVKRGDLVVSNILGTGVNVIATRNVAREE